MSSCSWVIIAFDLRWRRFFLRVSSMPPHCYPSTSFWCPMLHQHTPQLYLKRSPWKRQLGLFLPSLFLLHSSVFLTYIVLLQNFFLPVLWSFRKFHSLSPVFRLCFCSSFLQTSVFSLKTSNIFSTSPIASTLMKYLTLCICFPSLSKWQELLI